MQLSLVFLRACFSYDSVKRQINIIHIVICYAFYWDNGPFSVYNMLI